MKAKDIDLKKLLNGRYEAELLPKDFSEEKNVPDYAFNILNQAGLLYRPVIDEHHLETGGEKPVWPDNRAFAVCLTHDVDAVTELSLMESARKRRLKFSLSDSASQILINTLGTGFDLAKLAFRFGKKDPFHCMEQWLQVEEQVGARSTFFFWPGLSSVTRHHVSDCTYELHDRIIFEGQKCLVAEMIREINSRGWEVGLHPSWYSFNNADELKQQKEALERALGREIVSLRQHFLHYDIRITPRVQAEAGLMYDSTLGFNDNIGFRFGTCYPWYLYDLRDEKELPIMEIPLIIQDGAMLLSEKGMRLDEETAFSYIKQITVEVENVGGVLTLIWHPHSITMPDWWNLYNRTLEYLQEKDPWFATIKEIGAWWSDTRNRID